MKLCSQMLLRFYWSAVSAKPVSFSRDELQCIKKNACNNSQCFIYETTETMKRPWCCFIAKFEYINWINFFFVWERELFVCKSLRIALCFTGFAFISDLHMNSHAISLYLSVQTKKCQTTETLFRSRVCVAYKSLTASLRSEIYCEYKDMTMS